MMKKLLHYALQQYVKQHTVFYLIQDAKWETI